MENSLYKNDKEMMDYDAACKRVLSLKVILAHIMQRCLDEYKDCEIYDIADKYIIGEPVLSDEKVHRDDTAEIFGEGTEDSSLLEGKVTYDILFHAFVPNTDEKVGLIINVEAQKKYYPGYSLIKRAVYYCSRLISSQYKDPEFKAKSYDGIKKVFSIWVCTAPPKYNENTIARIRLNQQDLLGRPKYNADDIDLLEIIMICTGKKEDSQKYDRLIRLLTVTLTNKPIKKEILDMLKNEYNINLSNQIISEVSKMCDFSIAVREEGREEGRAEGREEGRAEGRVEGKALTVIDNINNVMQSFGSTLEQALKALHVSEEEYLRYKVIADGE